MRYNTEPAFFKLDDNGNMKSFDFSPWGGIEGFLEMTSNGGTVGTSGIGSQLVSVVPDLYRAVDMTATAVASLPFDICNESGDVIDSSVEWQNTLGGVDNPQRLLYLIASSLCGGSAYVFPEVTNRMIVELRYFAPQTIFTDLRLNGSYQFIRTANGASETYQPDELLHFWLPDRSVEIGPAMSHPLGNATLSASIKLATSNAIKSNGERGFVPPTLLMAKGVVGDVTRIESWWNRWLRNAFGQVAKLVNAEFLDVKTVGATMDQLKGVFVEINREASEDIGKAFGIPAALFMSDNAYASEFKQIRKQWKSESIFVTLYHTIEETFTEQLFKRFGCYMKFNPETLDEFHDDEAELATTLVSFVSAFEKDPEIAKLGTEILGYDMTEEQETELERIVEERTKKKETEPTMPPAATPPPDEQNDLIEPPQEAQPVRYVALKPEEMKEIVLWKQIAVRSFTKGRGNVEDFRCKALSESIASPIRAKLKAATSEREIVQAFEIESMPEQNDSALFYLADAITKAAGISES